MAHNSPAAGGSTSGDSAGRDSAGGDRTSNGGPSIGKWIITLLLLCFALLLLAAVLPQQDVPPWLSPRHWLGQDVSATQSPSGLPTTSMQIGDQTFSIEIANTEATREYGLMNRDGMPGAHGMIFVFPHPQPVSFYMKNTRFPLDIVFIDAGGKVTSIHQMQPYVESPTTDSVVPVKWAIELNVGAAVKAAVQVGEQLQIPQAAQAADWDADRAPPRE